MLHVSRIKHLHPALPQLPIAGCTDSFASNHNPAATMDDGSCDYLGCTKIGYYGYNPRATIDDGSCGSIIGLDLPDKVINADEWSGPIDIGEVLCEIDCGETGTLNIGEGQCIAGLGYNENWNVSFVGEKASLSYYGGGFDDYKYAWGEYTDNFNDTPPNGFSSWELIDMAFKVLLEVLPDGRIFVNNPDLTPWIIPAFTEDGSPNEDNIKTFKGQCTGAGGTMYTHTTPTKSPEVIRLEEEAITIETAIRECGGTIKELEGIRQACLQNERTECYTEQRAVDEKKRECEELNQQLDNTLKQLSGVGEVLSGSIISDKDQFVTCLCEAEEVPCGTFDIDSISHVINSNDSVCIKTWDEYNKILTYWEQNGWDKSSHQHPTPHPPNQLHAYSQTETLQYQRTFFNTHLLKKLSESITEDVAEQIVRNYFTTNISDSTGLTPRAIAIQHIKNAFDAGGNFWIPLSPDLATDVIHREECCKEATDGKGIYSSELICTNNDCTESLKLQVGVCLGSEGTPPCPTLQDGSISVELIRFERKGSAAQGIRGITEACCDNKILQFNGNGEFTWTNGFCILDTTTTSVACTTPTVITINESPVSTGDCDTVTVSAYIYFTEPTTKCTNGKFINDFATPLTDLMPLYRKQPKTAEEVSRYSNQKNFDKVVRVFDQDGNRTMQGEVRKEVEAVGGIPREKSCCYDTENPIQGKLIIQNESTGAAEITYVDTFTSQQTNLNTTVSNVGIGFNTWVKLTTVVSNAVGSTFNIAVELSDGLFECCDYDIYFDDIAVDCGFVGVRDIYETEKCPGFDLKHVIDNKKSWVYNPGTEAISNSTMDNIIRGHGTKGMNIAQSSPNIIDGGHGPINRVFAPSVDADLPFRDTDYYGLHGVIERHSDLVLNSKEVLLQFNMCADTDCLTGGPFPNLVQLENFKKTFQDFWLQFMEQFIPATTIFVSGEKWCNSRICQEKIATDYFLGEDEENVYSPPPVNTPISEEKRALDVNVRTLDTPVEDPIGEIGGEGEPIGATGGESLCGKCGYPIKIGDIELHTLKALNPDLYKRQKSRVMKREPIV